MDWAERRQLAYIATALLIFSSIVGFFIYKHFDVPPTCFDGKQNADEQGIDCGGQSSCNKYCEDELAPPTVRWVRVFKVTPSIVHAVAYIEHGNPRAAAYKAGYTFRLYDNQGGLVTERKGQTFIGTLGKTAIVDTVIPVGNTDPDKVSAKFALDNPISWQKINPALTTVVFNTDRTLLETVPTGTRLTATIQNQSRFRFRDMDIVALLNDADGNAIAVSKALLSDLGPLATEQVTFTWSYRMPRQVVNIEIIPRFNPFTTTDL